MGQSSHIQDAGGRARKGAVLILVLAVLVILALLGVTFVNAQTLHKNISGSWTDSVRAKLLAQSGLEAAVEELRGMASNPAGPATGSATMVYFGSETNETLAPNPGTALEDAANPSFAVEQDGDPSNGPLNALPRSVPVMGVSRGISGTMATGTYGLNADTYTLKVFDTSSQIHVNEGLNHPYQSAVLERVLNRLGDDPSIAVAGLGTTIVSNRPPTGYADKGAVAALFNSADAKKFINLVTCHAWVDKNVANPVPLSNDSAAVYFVPTVAAGPTPPIFQTRPSVGGVKVCRYGRNRRYDGQVNTSLTMFYGTGSGMSTTLGQTSIYGHDELNPRYIELAERAPVNINTASRAVLVALLRDLEGFFLLEQKRMVYPSGTYPDPWAHLMANYNWAVYTPYCYYDWNALIPTHVRYAHTAGEIGVPFRTTAVDAVMAGAIADAVLARRITSAFAGWQDFSMFVDSLVGTTIVDPRANSDFRVYNNATISSYYTLHAAQAIADTIKANFNPNLHLNEVNPDLAINLLVDKTDLIQSSTEFCFNPTGTYEIESLGRVLRPEGTQDAFTALDNTLMAQARASAVIRLFSVYRESSQKDFYAGTRSNSASASPTYGNYALQIGPEPDNGPAPADTEYEGYVTLATYGGSLAVGTQKTPSALTPTPVVATTTSEAQSALVHGHFDLDYRLHASTAAGQHEILTKTVTTHNPKDRTEDTQTWTSPYCSAYDTSRYRIARSYKWGDSFVATLVAPPDLRIDGTYVERGSAPMFHSLDGNFNACRGTVSYWLKPGFEPEFMGKTRIFFNMDQGGGAMGGGTFTMMHGMTPGYADVDETTSFAGYANAVGRPTRNVWGLTVYSDSAGTRHVRTPGRASPIPTHFNHSHATPVINKLKQTWIRHTWVHATVSWDIGINDATLPVPSTTAPQYRLYVNGRDPTDETAERSLNASAWGGDFGVNMFDNQYNWDWKTPRQMNPIRLGAQPWYDAAGTSGVGYYPTQRSRRVRNYPADVTVDEFYLWGLSHTDATTWNKAIAQWNLGRYYRENDGVFTSQAITLPSSTGRALAPATTTAPPPPGEGGAPASVNVPAVAGGTRVLGISWTVYGIPPASMSSMVNGTTLAAFRYAIHNYQPTMFNASPAVVTPLINARVSFDGGTTWSAWMTNPAWANVQQSVAPGGSFKYQISFNSGADPLNAILLSAPILDDVTVYYDDFAYLQLSLN